MIRVVSTSIRAISAAFALAWASLAHADPGVAIEVEGRDAPAIRSAVERELAAIAPPPAGVLSIRHQGDDATVVFVSSDGRRIERTIHLQSTSSEAAEEIALVAANLARDDAALIADLAPPAPDDPSPSPVPGPESAPAPTVATDPAREPVPPVVAPTTKPTTKPASATAPADVDPCTSKVDLFPGSVDFAPFVGMSSSARIRNATRVVALNVLGGIGAGLRGFEVGTIANLVTGPVCGMQLVGVLNVAGRMSGLQASAVVGVVAGRLDGGQVAAVTNVTTGELRGMQLAALLNVAGRDVRGVQVGAINVAAGRVRGVQIGLVNVAEKSDLSIGVINVNYRGRTHADAWSNLEIGMIAAGVKHGGDHWHSIYGVGTRVTDPTFIGILGIGGHVRFSERIYLDLDVLSHITSSFADGHHGAPFLQARPVLGVNLAAPFALYAGAAFNALITTGADASWAPDYAFDAGTIGHLWPGAVFGMQAFAE